MKRSIAFVTMLLIPVLLTSSTAKLSDRDITWSSDRSFRVLVKVDPVDINGRTSDEMPASFPVSFEELLVAHNISGQVDLSSLQVHKYDPTTGTTEGFKAFDTAISEYDRPCRFDDDVLPQDYPSRVGYASEYPNGRPGIYIMKRKARLFNRAIDNKSGKVVWVHTQQGDQPSYYAIYFNICGANDQPGLTPSPWIGDVDVLRKKEGQPIGGLSHFTVATGDFNGDGLFDLFACAEKGDLMWYPNRGTPDKPKFPGCYMMTDEQGPIDLGWYGAPFLYDWDNDKRPDMLVGTSKNVILWWKNTGTLADPKLQYMGFVQADGGQLSVPESPVPEDTKDVFKRDYYNQPWVGDWDGDGLPDILTGGYTTGLIFYYHCIGRDSNGVPILEYVGPLKADGETIDTTWAASPTAYDFDHDGKMELVTGSWWWSGIPYPPKPGQVEYLMYFDNTDYGLTRKPLPTIGKLPDENGEAEKRLHASFSIARASVADWNNDKLPDLLVNSGDQLYLYLNEGTADNPKWRITLKGLTIPWGIYKAYAMSINGIDMDADGTAEAVTGTKFYSIAGSPYSPTQTYRGIPTVSGKPIEHPGPGYGDLWLYTGLSDWDKDGKVDLLWGTQQGNIYLHRGLGGSNLFDFDEGIKLKLNTGEALRVGPPVFDSPEDVVDFTILQGSRIRFLADDFDKDGIDDLAVTETYGNVWIFLNTKTGGIDTFRPGVKVSEFDHFVFGFNTIDWNGDGKTDIISQGTAFEPGLLLLNESKPGQPKFSKPFRPDQLQTLPHVFWGPDFRGTDWNSDGDDDVIIRAEFYSFWAERSYLKHGYRQAGLIGLEKKD